MLEHVPLVSFLMAGFNSKIEFLKIALESIKNQTYRNYELVFVDDGCKDEIIQLVESYSDYFSVIVLHNDSNLGLPKSLNKGLRSAKGKYIARFDDDDVNYPERIEKQVEYMELHQDIAGCWSEYEIIDNKGMIIGKSRIGNIDFLKRFVSKGNCCCHSSLLIRKDVLVEFGGYNEKFTYAQDLELYLRVLSKYRMKCIDSICVQFRKNTTRNPLDKKILAFVYSYAAALEYASKDRRRIIKWYILLRTLILVKFSVLDIYRLDED